MQEKPNVRKALQHSEKVNHSATVIVDSHQVSRLYVTFDFLLIYIDIIC